jgi:hypothetical protein
LGHRLPKENSFEFVAQRLTLGAVFSVLRLRQRNGAKRLLPAGLFLSYYSFF